MLCENTRFRTANAASEGRIFASGAKTTRCRKNRSQKKTTETFSRRIRSSAEREGFEPPEPLSSTVFKTAAIDHSAIFPTAKVAPFFISAKSFFRRRPLSEKTNEKKALHLPSDKVAEPLNRPFVSEFRILGHLVYRTDFILKTPERFANPHEIYQRSQKRKHDSDYQAGTNHRAEDSRQPYH